jgi:hypothetical protein
MDESGSPPFVWKWTNANQTIMNFYAGLYTEAFKLWKNYELKKLK